MGDLFLLTYQFYPILTVLSIYVEITTLTYQTYTILTMLSIYSRSLPRYIPYLHDSTRAIQILLFYYTNAPILHDSHCAIHLLTPTTSYLPTTNAYIPILHDSTRAIQIRSSHFLLTPKMPTRSYLLTYQTYTVLHVLSTYSHVITDTYQSLTILHAPTLTHQILARCYPILHDPSRLQIDDVTSET